MDKLFIKVKFSNSKEMSFLKGILPIQIIKIIWKDKINVNLIAVFVQNNFWDLMKPIKINCNFNLILKNQLSQLDMKCRKIYWVKVQILE